MFCDGYTWFTAKNEETIILIGTFFGRFSKNDQHQVYLRFSKPTNVTTPKGA